MSSLKVAPTAHENPMPNPASPKAGGSVGMTDRAIEAAMYIKNPTAIPANAAAVSFLVKLTIQLFTSHLLSASPSHTAKADQLFQLGQKPEEECYHEYARFSLWLIP
jgi:hypothetical protein